MYLSNICCLFPLEQPHPHEASLVNSRKSTQPSATSNDEPATGQAIVRKSAKLNKSAPAATLEHSASDADPSAAGSGSPATLLNASAGGTLGSSTASGQKMKRGRKLKIGVGTAAAAATSKENLAQAAKKKRGRKSVPETSQTPTAASTSDEDEECSATNCVRPAGKCKMRLDGLLE